MDRFVAIDAFVRVAEARSFAEAARRLRVSRSVITARIQQLEEFVGAPLFHRNTRSVRLSDLASKSRPYEKVLFNQNQITCSRRCAPRAPRPGSPAGTTSSRW